MSNKKDNNSCLEYSENPKSDTLITVETEIRNVKQDNQQPPSAAAKDSPPARRRKK
ncbi:TPA: hypothetical protein ACISZU_000195 [Salmonella enterica subsp. enterica serovar Potsdam]